MIQFSQIPNLGAYGFVPAPISTPIAGGNIRWVWWLIAAVIVVGAVFFYFQQNVEEPHDKPSQPPPSPPKSSDSFLPEGHCVFP